MTDQGCLDQSALARLRDWGGHALLGDMLDLFFEDTPQRIEEARGAERQGDLKALARSAHTLQSHAKYLGAVEFAQRAARLQEQTGREAKESLSLLIDDLEAAYVRVRARLEVVRRDLGGS